MIKIVTDSTSYLERHYIQENDIKIVPIKISFGDKLFKEGIDITTSEFYELLKSNEILPKTSQPSVQDFIDVYKPIIDKGHEIISIHVSGALSGTINAASIAKNTLLTDKICIIDSQSTGVIIQFLIEKAIALIKENAKINYICTSLNALVKKMLSMFILDNLDYMVKGGRLNKAEVLINSFLHIRPMVSFTNGKTKLEGLTRSWSDAKNKLFGFVEKVMKTQGIEKFGLHFGANFEEAEEFKKKLQDLIKIPVIMRQVGSSLGTYGGHKWLGVGIQTK